MRAGYRSLWEVLRVLTLIAVLTASTTVIIVEPAEAGGGVSGEVKSGKLVIIIYPSSPEIKSQFEALLAGGSEKDPPSARIIAGGQVVKNVPLHGKYLDNIEKTGNPAAPFPIEIPLTELSSAGEVSIEVFHGGRVLDSAETSVEAVDIGGAPAPGGREEGQGPGGSRSGEGDHSEPEGSRSEEPDREEPRDPQRELQPPTMEEPEDPQRLARMGRDIANAIAKVLSQTPEDLAQLDSVSQDTYSKLNKNAPLMPHWDDLTEMQRQKVIELLAFAVYAKYLSEK